MIFIYIYARDENILTVYFIKYMMIYGDTVNKYINLISDNYYYFL